VKSLHGDGDLCGRWWCETKMVVTKLQRWM
jgi:hypothetical protein